MFRRDKFNMNDDFRKDKFNMNDDFKFGDNLFNSRADVLWP